MTATPAVLLRGAVAMPQVGIGVFLVDDADAERVVRTAIDAGYRSVDTAAAYQNERGVGRAVAACGVPRGDLFVTTKIWNTEHGFSATTRAARESLDRLGLDYVDLLLVHWPVPEQDRYVPTWQALLHLREAGLARAVGVSNFQPEHITRLLEATGEPPAVNQVELHPLFTQDPLRRFGAATGIVTEAWHPLAPGTGLLTDPVVARIAVKHGRSAAQVVLRWHVQQGHVVIPKSTRPERIRENIDVYGFALDVADMADLDGLNQGKRLGPDPATFFLP
ncbi:aldo/keto reductase [Micromonospora marina]|uniref:aldo/keto reductase n=1 Tax=Micromonospora marina TaxID=307120 RepID=UPI003453A29F